MWRLHLVSTLRSTVSSLERTQCGLLSFSALFSFFYAVTINKSCRTSKTGEVFSQQQATAQSLSTASKYITSRFWALVCAHANRQRRHCWVSLTGPYTQTHTHTCVHTYTHPSHKVASCRKKEKKNEIEFIHEITIQHVISDYTRSPTGRSIHQTNIHCLPSPLFQRALPPSVLCFLSQCFLFFHYFFAFVCQPFALLFVLFWRDQIAIATAAIASRFSGALLCWIGISGTCACVCASAWWC